MFVSIQCFDSQVLSLLEEHSRVASLAAQMRDVKLFAFSALPVRGSELKLEEEQPV